MKTMIPGNRIYTIYHVTNNMNEKYMVVARDNAHCRKLVKQKLKPVNTFFKCSWNIYDGNHGITKLPVGTVIHLPIPTSTRP